MDAVVHCAAPVVFWGPWEGFARGIVQATGDLSEHASRHGVHRFVYISSESAIQDNVPLLDVDESYPYPNELNSYYGQAKMLAEVGLREQDSQMVRTILRPAYIWGAGSTSTEAIVNKVRAGTFAWVGHGDCVIETVHVENVVEAIVLALTGGVRTDTYFVTDDDPITFREFLTPILALHDLTTPGKNLPRALAYRIAAALEFSWKFMRMKSEPPLTRFTWAFVALPRRYNISKIGRELGYRPIISRQEGLEDYARDIKVRR
jgi:nucleoside-diphosphate-sugar epimerase